MSATTTKGGRSSSSACGGIWASVQCCKPERKGRSVQGLFRYSFFRFRGLRSVDLRILQVALAAALFGFDTCDEIPRYLTRDRELGKVDREASRHRRSIGGKGRERGELVGLSAFRPEEGRAFERKAKSHRYRQESFHDLPVILGFTQKRGRTRFGKYRQLHRRTEDPAFSFRTNDCVAAGASFQRPLKRLGGKQGAGAIIGLRQSKK